MKKLLFSITLIACCLLAANVFAARTTRDLVFDDDSKTTTQADSKDAKATDEQTLAIKTTIVLTRDGTTSTVKPSHDFQTGDALKLVFTPSADGYVYWMSKGSSGNYSILFPAVGVGMDNSVKRNVEYTVPAKGAFKFDSKTGTEELLCILAEQKIADIDAAVASAAAAKAQVDENCAKYLAGLEQKNESKRKTRDLVFDDDDAGDVNTKKQTAKKGEPFVGHFTLNHK